MIDSEAVYVLARRVLLDALQALVAHRDAFVVVGAQAVYLRVGEGDLAVAPYTRDADLAIDPARLAEVPPLEQALTDAAFRPKSSDQVGTWITTRRIGTSELEIPVDLLVPAAVSPGKGRAARLPGHHHRAARRVAGLDGALVDEDEMELAALEPTDPRSVTVRVAGPAALLIAKLHKIADRRGSDRTRDKDALDVLRLLRGTSTAELSQRYRRLLADERAAAVAREGQTMLAAQFAAPDAVGVEMAVRATQPLVDPDEIAASCRILASELLAALG